MFKIAWGLVAILFSIAGIVLITIVVSVIYDDVVVAINEHKNKKSCTKIGAYYARESKWASGIGCLLKVREGVYVLVGEKK